MPPKSQAKGAAHGNAKGKGGQGRGKHAAKAAANASTQLARAPFTQGLAVHCFHLFPSLWHHREPPTVAIRLGGTTVGQPLLGRWRAAGFMRKSSAINATYSNKYQNYLIYSIYMYYIWLVVWDHEFYFSHILGISSSQLTNSYLSEG